MRVITEFLLLYDVNSFFSSSGLIHYIRCLITTESVPFVDGSMLRSNTKNFGRILELPGISTSNLPLPLDVPLDLVSFSSQFLKICSLS